MALDAAEEENIEAVKRWWEDNGKFLSSVVIVVAVAWGGWTFWENSREATKSAASDLYQQILSLAIVGPEAEVTEADRASIAAAAQLLKDDYPDSVYALYGAMFVAQQAVESGDLEGAQTELEWVRENAEGGLLKKTDPGLRLSASLRLGRVLLASGDNEAALDLVEAIDPQSFEAEFAELRGDIYVALGRNTDAQDAYTTALEAGGTSAFLRMKLDELAIGS